MQDKLAQIKAQVLGRFEVRKTVTQKAAFAKWASDYAQALGYAARTERSGTFVDTRNLIFGDLERANVLITAHYDTCARLPFPNFMTPQCWSVILLTQVLLPAVIFGALGFAAGFGAAMLLAWLNLPAGIGAAATSLTVGAMIALLIYLMLAGPANPHTANDNTSGVAAVLLAMHAFAGRKDVAFVLFDNEEKGLLGASAFVKAHGALAKRAFVVNLDCVSDGDTLLYAGSKAAMKSTRAKKLIAALEAAAPAYGKHAATGVAPGTFYPSDQVVFSRGTAFAALKGKCVLYLDRIHTAKDTVFMDENILCLVEAMVKGI